MYMGMVPGKDESFESTAGRLFIELHEQCPEGHMLVTDKLEITDIDTEKWPEIKTPKAVKCTVHYIKELP